MSKNQYYPAKSVRASRTALMLSVLLIAMCAMTLRAIRHRAKGSSQLEEMSLVLLAQAGMELAMGNAPLAADRLREIPPEQRGPEWGFLMNEADPSVMTLRGHDRSVGAVAFSPDGSLLASAGYYVMLWDVATGKARTRINFNSPCTSLVFDPTSGLLLVGTGEGSVHLWNAKEYGRHGTHKLHEGKITSITFSPDGKLLATSSWKDTVLLDAETFEVLHRFSGGDNQRGPAVFTPDGKYLAVWVPDELQFWNITTKQKAFQIAMTILPPSKFAFSPDNRAVALNMGPDLELMTLDRATGEVITAVPGHEQYLNYGWRINDYAYHPSGDYLATASPDRTVRFWDAQTLQELRVLRGHTGEVRAIAFSPDGRQFASGSQDTTVRLWKAGSSQWLKPASTSPLTTNATISPDGSTVLAGKHDLHVYDFNTGESHAIDRRQIRNFDALAYSADGLRVAIGMSHDLEIQLWNADLTEQLGSLKGHEGRSRRWAEQIYDLEFSPDNTRLASSGSDKTIRIWDVQTMQEVTVLRGHREPAWAISFSPDGHYLASAGYADKSWRLWDLDTGQQRSIVQCEAYISSTVFHPDGRLVAFSESRGGVSIFDLEADAVIRQFGYSIPIRTMLFTPDGSRLITAESNMIRFWDTETGLLLATLAGHKWPIESLAMDASGQNLVSSTDRSVRRWKQMAVKADEH